MSFDTYNVLILGPSGAGKTVFLASLFKLLSTQGEKGFFLNSPDGKQRHMLNTVYAQIINGEKWPAGTRSLSNWEFECCVKSGELDIYPVFKFSYTDYSGGLLTEGKTDEDETFVETLQAADAILALIDGSSILKYMKNPDDRDVAIWVHKDIPGTMQELNRYNKRIPIQFIISKWDLLEDQYTLANIVAQLMKISEFRNVVEQRKSAGCPLRLIPISSVGSNFATLQPDGSMKKNLSVIPKPFQVEIPLFSILIDRIKGYSNDSRRSHEPPSSAPTPDARKPRFEFLQQLINSITVKPMPGIQDSHEGTGWQKISDETTALNYIVGLFINQLRQFELRFPDSKLTQESIFPNEVVSSSVVEDARYSPQSAFTSKHCGLYRTLRGHTMGVRSVRFLHQNNEVVGGGFDNKVIFWKCDSGKIIKILAETGKFVLTETSKNIERLITASGDHYINIRDSQTHKILMRWKAHKDLISSIAVSPDFSTVISCSHDKTIKVWSLGSDSYQLLQTLSGHQGIVYDISVASDWRTLASVGTEKSVFLWDLQNGTIIDRLGGYPGYLRAVEFNHDGSRLAYGGLSNEVYLWDCTRKQLASTLRMHNAPIASLAFNQQGTMLASGGEDNEIHLWDPTIGAHITVLKGHMGRVNTLAFSPDALLLASGSRDCMVNLWNVT